MLLIQRFILLIGCCFLNCNALQCSTNCSYTFNFDTPFNVPSRCNQQVSAEKCRVQLTFWYYLQEYVVNFEAEPSKTIISTDNQRTTMIEIKPTESFFFYYGISHTCTNGDNCAQEFAQIAVYEIIERQINYLAIVNELRPLILTAPQSANDSDLACFNSNENVQQCAIANIHGTCTISDKLIENEIIQSCSNDMHTKLSYLNISDSGSHATFNINCNRPLCNGQLTLKAVKDIMFKYNVTLSPQGRLNNGSQFIKISSGLMMIIVVTILINLN
ncbi:unnamed protein product [Adineta steineri]|uniref:Uncharacterized protein n=1 Tax=Adineta steineri TaxID=433720 RepID=A0A814KA65_9BILA|nr:unnamed protein product [Adineta steineri]CAF3576744.1 unnamed protein product [Adineta steineri]